MATIDCAKSVNKNTSIAGATFKDGQSYRIFYQAPDGAIHAFYTNNFGAQWEGGDQQVMVPNGRAMMTTPMSTVMFTSTSGPASRTFYIGINREIRVFGVTGGRLHDGIINNGAFVAAKYSSISAIAWASQGHVHIRIYFQAVDDHIQEICWDEGQNGDNYKQGHRFPIPLRGTDLAFVCIPPTANDGVKIRGYYQDIDLQIREILWDHGWQDGELINGTCKVESQCHISACISSVGQISVYWTNHCSSFSSVTECVHRGGKWLPPKLISICCSPTSPRILCCAHVPAKNTQTRIRLFFVGVNGLINHARRENEHWGWGGQQGGKWRWEKC